MTAIELARRMAQLGETKEALRAYALALRGDATPDERYEAALYTLQNEGDYKLAYTAFVELHRAGRYRSEALSVLTQAIYEPNLKPLKNRYERNCKALAKYPYLFRKDFLPFDDLPIRFFPFDDYGGYVPFDVRTQAFLDYVNFSETVISRNFFKNMEKPILASDVYSQYELDYLNDNVRKSEWAGRENHLYLHYADWGAFCAHLAVLDLRALVESKKAVFLIGDERARYPIDFKAEFGVDYSQYPVKPFGVREITKLIWHTQLSAHNGGDFFNEIFDYHPNLLFGSSMMLSDLERVIGEIRAILERSKTVDAALAALVGWEPRLVRELYGLKGLTDKDVLVAMYLRDNSEATGLDRAARIAPALFLQPHFPNVEWNIQERENGDAELTFGQADYADRSQMFRGFRYVKTFLPLRRPTTSSAASVHFMWWNATGQRSEAPEGAVVGDEVVDRILNRGDLRDPDNRFFRDAVLVRFEDGKLNPKATFSALAAFLDLPYTESMTYGSIGGDRDPYQWGEGYQGGFFTGKVNNAYDEYLGRSERVLVEYFLRDLYTRYGYDFQYYDGAPMDAAALDALAADCATLDGYYRESHKMALDRHSAQDAEGNAKKAEELLRDAQAHRRATVRFLLAAPRFVSRRGKPLEPTPLLAPDEELLQQPLYR